MKFVIDWLRRKSARRPARSWGGMLVEMRDLEHNEAGGFSGVIVIDNVETFVDLTFDDIQIDYVTLRAAAGGLEPYESEAARPNAGQLRAIYDVIASGDVMWGHLPRTFPEFMASNYLLATMPELRSAVKDK